MEIFKALLGHTLGKNNHEIQPRSEKTPQRILGACCSSMTANLDVPYHELDGQYRSKDHDFRNGDIVTLRRGGQHDIVGEVERHVDELCMR